MSKYAILSDIHGNLQKEKEKQSESMTKRIKVKLSDIDMSGINTDAFSNKIDAFLDAKSDQLIKDWSLATTNDLEELESKFNETTANVDDLDKSFKEFKKSSEEYSLLLSLSFSSSFSSNLLSIIVSTLSTIIFSTYSCM